MNILIVGCGKVGSRLADVLCQMGHDVSIVDHEREHFTQLSDDFSGFTIQGVPIDQDILRQAGIEGCDAIAAVTEDDNTNIMVCQIAREIFHVDKIIARIYDPLREDIFSRFNIKSICPTNMTVSSVYSILTDREQTKHLTLGQNVLAFSTVKPPKEIIGLSIQDAARVISPENLFAVMDEQKKIIMVTEAFINPNVTFVIHQEDRLIIETSMC